MNDKLEKTLKELIPYIIVTGILFLLLPIFMGKSAGFMTYLIELVAFPLTALGCGIVYKIKKKRNNLFLCLIAPIFYALAALLYGMWRASWYTVLIYIAAYSLCGYLGQILGDILPIGKKGSAKSEQQSKPAERQRRVSAEEKPAKRHRTNTEEKTARPARRVNVEEISDFDDFVAQDPEKDNELDTSTTDDDIEAILQSIHNRKQQ